MISIVIEKAEGQYHRVLCRGHAGYARSGEDIVCAAVSILVINTVNAIDRFTQTRFQLHSDDSEGYIEAVFDREVTDQAGLLLDTMVMGLEEIHIQYPSFLSLSCADLAMDYTREQI